MAHVANRFAHRAVPVRDNPEQRNDAMRIRMAFFGLLAAVAIGAAACGSSSNDATVPAAEQVPATTAAQQAPATTAAASVKLADTSLGKIIVDADGRTLYAFTKDTNGAPTCVDACAKAWPASSVTGSPVAGAGIAATLRAITAPTGGSMIAAGKWPLYRFAGDAGPGETNGQGTAGVWFAVAPDGTLIK
jgi:predicted lipoprotein with Yx(FWY)xxD motif